jgi:hypothetical protein
MRAVVADLEEKRRKTKREMGTRSASYLAAAPLRTVLVRYRFTDYQADETATAFPSRGTMLREHYMSARDQYR